MNTFSDALTVFQEYFEDSCFKAEIQTRLGFRKRRKRLKPVAVPTILYFNPPESHV